MKNKREREREDVKVIVGNVRTSTHRERETFGVRIVNTDVHNFSQTHHNEQ